MAKKGYRRVQSQVRRGLGAVKSITPPGTITLGQLTHAIGIGLGASRDPSRRGGWHFDMRHGPPRDRLPMCFHARAVAAPAALHRSSPLEPVSLGEVEAPQLDGYGYSPLARPVLVFVEKTTKPVLPDQLEMQGKEGERLFWRLVSTDSCEAAHCGELITQSAAGGSEQPAAAYRAPSSHHTHMTLNLLPSSPPLPITHTCTQARCSLCVL